MEGRVYIQPLGYILPTFIYSQPLNNMGLNCAGPLIGSFLSFSKVNIMVLHDPRLLESTGAEPRVQHCGYGRTADMES